MLWNRYQYTLDEQFLKEKAYPVIRDIATFYVNYGKLGADGLYHVAPAVAWEEPPIGRDAHSDCAAWRAIFPIAIEATAMLKVDQDKIPIWRERLSKAPPYPLRDGIFSRVIQNDGTPAPIDHYQWQLPNTSSVFPFSVIGIDSPPELKKTAENTFLHYRYNADAGHEFLPVVAARLGQPEWLRAALFQYIQYFQVYDQGLLNYYNIFGQKEVGEGAAVELHPYLEASGIMATTVNETLLQSYNSIIRVFPALPEHWTARFILRATGSFLVASEHRGPADIPYILLQPIGGSARPCRIAIPWKEGVSVRAGMESVSCKVDDGIATFTAKPQVIYAITPKGTKLTDIPMVKEGFAHEYSPVRLGNCWYGSSENDTAHTGTFPIW